MEIGALCDRYHCLPSQVMKENAFLLSQLRQVESIVSITQRANKSPSELTESELEFVAKYLTNA